MAQGARDAGHVARELQIRTSSRNGRAHVVGHAQSFQGAGSETTGDRLEASARVNYRTVVDKRKRDGGELVPVYCWGRVSSLNPSEGRLGHLSVYSTCHLMRAEYCTQLKN